MRKVLFVTLVLALLLAGCSSAKPTATPTPVPTAVPTQAPVSTPTPLPSVAPTKPPTGVVLPEVNPLEVKGDIITAGSSTVYPLSEAIAEMFKDEGYKGNITIDSIGSGAGFERFCKTGETDISNASRPIKSSELEACRAIGREPIAFRVGTDALAVVVSKENTFLTNVTKEQLAKIFSTTSVKWSDVDPTWPNEDILRFSPGTDSGTFDFFVEEILGKKKELLLQAANLQLSEDDNVLVQGVLGSPYAIGYFGYAYYQENADKLKVLSIEGIAPNAETVDSGKYPLARPLFIYSTAKIMKEKPQVAAFINYYLTHVNEVIRRVGYFPASEEVLNASKKAWLEAISQ
ncbi:MAG: PstS family phosphate ABC transporter substrate-binding protein [Chloroflexi bacterium]|nr:PstS family phosphate ABC transporter substrate-binding protein [Chloroflexota bacterium]